MTETVRPFHMRKQLPNPGGNDTAVRRVQHDTWCGRSAHRRLREYYPPIARSPRRLPQAGQRFRGDAPQHRALLGSRLVEDEVGDAPLAGATDELGEGVGRN